MKNSLTVIFSVLFAMSVMTNIYILVARDLQLEKFEVIQAENTTARESISALTRELGAAQSSVTRLYQENTTLQSEVKRDKEYITDLQMRYGELIKKGQNDANSLEKANMRIDSVFCSGYESPSNIAAFTKTSDITSSLDRYLQGTFSAIEIRGTIGDTFYGNKKDAIYTANYLNANQQKYFRNSFYIDWSMGEEPVIRLIYAMGNGCLLYRR
jgi:regulator of replication initiation timing